MRKSLAIGLALLLVFAFAGMALAQDSDSVNIDMEMYVDEYIETMGDTSWDLGTTYHTTNYGPSREQIYESNGWDLAYANCPFSMTVSGNNLAGDGIPTFAREEQGANSNGFDRLPSYYKIFVITNENADEFTGWVDPSEKFPISKDYSEAPHNGQIRMNMTVQANTTITHSDIPLKATLIDPRYTWKDSADAGTYEASLTVTISAL